MAKPIDLRKTRKTLFSLLRPEAGFFWVAIAYGVAISLMTLAVPIAVQTLINSIANIGSTRAVVILAVVLFLTLFISGVFSALRMRVMEFYERKVYARLTADLGLKTILAPHSFFEGRQNVSITQRYFDIMTFQKNMPSLMIDGFALVLQMLVGFTLVSFYHPALFAFNVVLLLTMYAVWKLWGRGAKRTAIELSHAKYDSAKWLHDIAIAHEFFKSADHVEYAGRSTESYISNYVQKHKNHFHYTFSQVVMFLLMYAVASAALLGIGGVLVVQGELSIGQLVAAELAMSAVFFGLSRFTQYLKLYYELYGAAEKLGGALAMPQEELNTSEHIPASSRLVFNDVDLKHGNDHCLLNVVFEPSTKYFVTTDKSWVQKQLLGLLKQYDRVKAGDILLGELSLNDYDTHELRQAVTILDRSLIIEVSIERYLKLANPQASIADIRAALTEVEMTKVIDSLPDGLQTKVSVLGAPLQPLEFLLLKLAAAIIAKPKLLILNQHFDAIPIEMRERLLRRLDKYDFTVMYFTNIPIPDCLDGVLHLHDNATEMLNEYIDETAPTRANVQSDSSNNSNNNKEGE
ncbi:MAG: ABC transporter ATP-binding protein [Pseudomonadota bacterium]|nr:ABC transporter ATP-binding protein [Pseudomonadota bacterium]MEC8965898.1 ABC transporter ATP-binding protein [Pseudomonadota bacterium]MEC9277643.1 ABC transporter ATP-binding protein [Pseudomonadota bacterium]MEE3130062.1 ABC transporter ATP-binding protein [Pseudomonadota bacterium]